MEFINEWNSIIPFHIDDSHLSNPTEDFMIKALTNYLKTLNFDVKIIQNNISSEDANVKTQAKIKLVHYIDHLYRIASDTHPFYFHDLIHPTPKKSKHVLKTILNYLHYFSMVRNEITDKATDAINKYNYENDKKIKFQVENESKKSAAVHVEKRLNDLNVHIPLQEVKLEQLSQKDKLIFDDCNKITEKLSIKEKQLKTLDSQINFLKEKLVSDNEIEHILSTRQANKKSIEEHEEIKQHAYKGAEENKMRLKNLEDEEHIIKTILQKSTISDGADCIANAEKKSNIIREIDLIRENTKKEMTKINTTKTKEANLEQLLANAKTNLTELTNSVTKGVEQANFLIAERENQISVIQEETAVEESNISQQLNERAFVVNAANDFFISITHF